MRKIIMYFATLLISVLMAGCIGNGQKKTPTEDPEKTPVFAGSNITTNGNGGKTDVGAWFVGYNNRSMWANNFGHNIPILARGLNDNGKFDVLSSTSEAMMDFYLEKCAEAKIDFLIFDATNGGFEGSYIDYGSGNKWIIDNYTRMCKRIKVWNDSHDWKIKYAMGIGVYSMIRANDSVAVCAERQAKVIYREFYDNEEIGSDNYYQVDGKPLLILYDWAENAAVKWAESKENKNFSSRFTVRAAQRGEEGTYGWEIRFGTVVHPEVEVVSPGWNNHLGEGIEHIYLRENGKRYQRDWETVLSNDRPRIVVIQALNDYHECSMIWPSDTSNCDGKNEEKWYNEDGELDPYMYWNMTVEYIKELRKYDND